MGGWYEVTATQGHVGAGRGRDITFYVRANDVSHAFLKCKHIPSLKKGFKDRYRARAHQVPDVKLVTDDRTLAYLNRFNSRKLVLKSELENSLTNQLNIY